MDGRDLERPFSDSHNQPRTPVARRRRIDGSNSLDLNTTRGIRGVPLPLPLQRTSSTCHLGTSSGGSSCPPSPTRPAAPALAIPAQPVSEHVRKFTLRATIWTAMLLLLVGLGGADESTAQLFQIAGSTPAPHKQRQAGNQVLPSDPENFANYPDITTPSCPNYQFSQSALCGPQHGGTRCRAGYCCSAWGFCGNDAEWCEYSFGLKCQLGYGRCWFNETTFCVDGPTLAPQTRTPTSTSTASTATVPITTSTATAIPTGNVTQTTLTRSSAVSTGTTLIPTETTTFQTTAFTSSVAPPTTEATTVSTTSSIVPPTTQASTTIAPSTTHTATPTLPSTTTTVTFPSDFVDPACSPYYATPTPNLLSRLFARASTEELPPPDACILPNPPSRGDVNIQQTASNYGTYAAVGAGVVGAAAAAAWGGGEIWSRRKKAQAGVV